MNRVNAAQTGTGVAVIFDDLSESVAYSPANGNLLTVIAYCGSSAAVMTLDDNGTTTWASAVALGGSAGKIWQFYGIAAGSPTSITASIDDNGGGGSNGWFKVIEWSGNAAASVLDDTASNPVTAATSHPTGTVDGTVSEHLALAAHLVGGGTITPDGTWTTEHENDTDGIGVSYKLGSSQASGLQATATTPGNEDSVNILGLFKGTGGAVPTVPLGVRFQRGRKVKRFRRAA